MPISKFLLSAKPMNTNITPKLDFFINVLLSLHNDSEERENLSKKYYETQHFLNNSCIRTIKIYELPEIRFLEKPCVGKF